MTPVKEADSNLKAISTLGRQIFLTGDKRRRSILPLLLVSSLLWVKLHDITAL